MQPPMLSPMAVSLRRISEDYKSGRLTADQRDRLKEQVLEEQGSGGAIPLPSPA